ncbi:HAD family hydrolase [Streptacidiphilus sp. PB12-B1b]|uniref:HAD family hydrolase n=1 Tax=Streptacidiphilus sp. PB12-B1b TaxID=2705012 RepID=UPI0015F89798|nr:HAD family hydrolase [Streptacidiphilus sp. PB12-B1b]QMU75646.1 HAD family hydrolase [Streptacidiphilus sp. PB12-B1b]
MKERFLVGSDLDRTLIYSPRALALDMADELAPRLLTVEVHHGRPLSFMTEHCAELLVRLIAAAEFVPVTTRTRSQYQRVHLPGPVPGWAPRYAICANGGHLLVDGVTDQDWHAQIQATLAQNCAPLDEIVHHLALAADPEWTLKRRVAEDLFAYLVVEREQLPAGWIEELTGWAAERGYTLSLQGRKVYLVPQPLTKSTALAEVERRTGASTVLTAGDSLLDAELLLAADGGYRPGHGELADTGWAAPGVTALTEVGVAAGEEIVRRLLARVQVPTAVR